MAPTWDIIDMFHAFLQAPTYHLGLEAVLLLMVLWLLFHKSYKFQRSVLTEKEKEQLISEWSPEPLVPEDDSDHYSLHPRTVSGKVGKYVSVDGQACLNVATHNYLGLVEHPKLEEAAVTCLKKYGVGSCGPRGFYGTVDIHLTLEKRLAKFMNVEETALYSYGFSTISSAIPAYSKHGDVIFCDDGVNFAIQTGLIASRSKICFFKHNDTEDLERLLLEQADLDKSNPKKARVTRRFLVVEGLYGNYGDLCPLPKLMELKKKYKVRIFIDETCSFGVLGENGRGITEYFNIPIDEIDLITSTLEGAIPAYGGFCAGTSFIVDHQRLSGLGYCFSASLPPLQAGVAIAALDILEADPGIVQKLRENCSAMHEVLKRPFDTEWALRNGHDVSGLLFNNEDFVLNCYEYSPVKHLYLPHGLSREIATEKLERIVDFAMDKGLALTVSRYLEEDEHKLPPPSIRLIVSALLTKEDMELISSVLKTACVEVL